MYKVSIVVPVYNQFDELKLVLDSLQNQTYSQDKFEVIIVDNNSTDNTRDLINDYRGVKYILQDEYLNSSYSSRNRGIEKSSGEVIVLLDGTVVPEKNWLAGGLQCMEEKKADIISSDVRFDFGDNVTAGNIYDSNNLSTEHKIENKGVAVTASLFVKKEVFDTMGLFKEGAETAEDLIWTWKASQNGFKIKYCYNSVAYKKAKTFRQALKKHWRDGKGQPAIRKEQGKKYVNPYKRLIRSLIPYFPGRVNKLAANKGVEVSGYLKFKLYFVAYAVRIVLSAANIYGEWKMKK